MLLPLPRLLQLPQGLTSDTAAAAAFADTIVTPFLILC
jgi:hypothetical protein